MPPVYSAGTCHRPAYRGRPCSPTAVLLHRSVIFLTPLPPSWGLSQTAPEQLRQGRPDRRQSPGLPETAAQPRGHGQRGQERNQTRPPPLPGAHTVTLLTLLRGEAGPQPCRVSGRSARAWPAPTLHGCHLRCVRAHRGPGLPHGSEAGLSQRAAAQTPTGLERNGQQSRALRTAGTWAGIVLGDSGLPCPDLPSSPRLKVTGNMTQPRQAQVTVGLREMKILLLSRPEGQNLPFEIA